MPKVTKKSQQEDVLQEAAPVAMEAGVEEPEEGQQAAAAGGGEPGVKPKFPPLSAYEQNGRRIEFRRVPVPQNRLTPLKNNWLALYKPVTENLKLDMRMNLKTRKVGRGAGRAGPGRAEPKGGAGGLACMAGLGSGTYMQGSSDMQRAAAFVPAFQFNLNAPKNCRWR